MDHKPKPIKPEDIVAMKGLGRSVISPDGKWATFTMSIPILESEKSENRSHIWVVATKGGEPFQLTNGPNGDSDPHWSLDSNKIAFCSKRNGDKSQIWVIPISGGEAKQLTYAKNGASNPRWSPDGKKMAFLAPEAESIKEEKRRKAKDDPIVMGENDSRQTHLWLIDLETMNEEKQLLFDVTAKSQDKSDKSRRLTGGKFFVSDPAWSPNGKEIAFVSSPSPKSDETMFRSAIYIVDVKTKKTRKLTPHKGGESAPRWSPNGREISFLHSPEGYGQRDLHIVKAKGGNSKNLTSKLDRNVDTPVWSTDGKVIYFGAMDRVRRHLYSIPKEGGKVWQITHGDRTIAGMSLADSGEAFLCQRSAPKEPAQLWTGSIRTQKLRRLVNLNPQISDFDLGEMEAIGWKSHDGLEVEGLLCLPVGYSPNRSYPLLVEPHGGPHGGARDFGFKASWQFFSGEGFAVFAPNFRGSDGYGRHFAKMNYSSWGLGDYQDIMTGVDHLIQKGIADPNRLVVGGWSYGGYMTAWIITQTDRFKAAFFGCGVSNLISMHGQTDIPSFMKLYFANGSPAQQPELYKKLSPISHIHRAKTPTLILHGVEDKRVPLPQSEELYAELKSIGVEVEFVKYPREGHGIGEPRHVLDSLKRQLEWYKKHLPP